MAGYSGVPDRAKANEQIIRAIQQGPFDLIWLDKGLAITGRTLAEVKRQQPRCRVVGSAVMTSSIGATTG